MKTMRSATVTSGFRSNVVQIGNRKYEVEKLTKSSRRRLLVVLEAVPDKDRAVELYSDLTPIAYFYFYKLTPAETPLLPAGDLGMFPAAHPRPMSPALSAYTAACPKRTRLYKKLLSIGRPDWTPTTHRAWLLATGWNMSKVAK